MTRDSTRCLGPNLAESRRRLWVRRRNSLGGLGPPHAATLSGVSGFSQKASAASCWPFSRRAASSSDRIEALSDFVRMQWSSSARSSAMCWSRVIGISCRMMTGRGAQDGWDRVGDRARARPAAPASGGAEMRQHFGGTARPRGGRGRPGTLGIQKRRFHARWCRRGERLNSLCDCCSQRGSVDDAFVSRRWRGRI